jgi:AGZA family xanthine/uracil permease-like MFS transporter
LQADAISTVIGAIAGTSTTTSYIESATGVAQGGRTGLSPVFTGVFFLLSVLFLPLFSVVPSFATAPALIIVGLFMMSSIKMIDFQDFSEGIPAFLTIVLMPFTFSISHGIGFGFLSYLFLKAFTGKIKESSPILWIIGMIFVYTLLKH